MAFFASDRVLFCVKWFVCVEGFFLDCFFASDGFFASNFFFRQTFFFFASTGFLRHEYWGIAMGFGLAAKGFFASSVFLRPRGCWRQMVLFCVVAFSDKAVLFSL